MLILSKFTYNGKAPKIQVTAKPVTPSPLHFMCNHGGIPDVDADKWTLRLEGLVGLPCALALADLPDESKFPRMERLVTIQCTGTRRIDQIGLYTGEATK